MRQPSGGGETGAEMYVLQLLWSSRVRTARGEGGVTGSRSRRKEEIWRKKARGRAGAQETAARAEAEAETEDGDIRPAAPAEAAADGPRSPKRVRAR